MRKKMFLVLLLLSFSSISFADIISNVSLLDKKNRCIYNDYYNKDGKFYYHYVYNDKRYSTSSKNYTNSIVIGYVFDTNTSICSPQNWLILGMDVKEWHFLEALTGVLFGFTFMIFTIYLFVSVGKEK
jgi:negative regulator of genetic competence, sporulation and motility